ncbi:hypothetical protein HNQ56_000907 [Anaerotaenia torta]|uniref:hypothetical protein n=1 Tax=Anaerotaenia torta TaxID=433293 RepID=UPI003D195FCC
MWVKIYIDGTRPFRLNLPISLYALKEFSQCLAELMELACFFIPNDLPSHSSFRQWVRAGKELVESVDILLQSFMDQKACDLVDVNAKNVSVAIKIQ